MKKVLHISKYYHPFIGGIEQVAKDCVNALKENYDQKIICFNHEKGNSVDLVDGIEVHRVGCFAKVASQSLSLEYGKVLKKIMKDYSPDIIIFHYPNPFAAHYLLKHKKRKFELYVYWHLDITKQKLLKILFNGQNKSLIKRATNVLGATPIHINDSKYYECFKNKSKILPYAIDQKRLQLSDENKNNIETLKEKYKDKIVCFFIGRHVEYKGLKYLIEASKYVDDRYKFLIAGSGPLTDDLKKQALGDDKIEFLGRVSDDQWREYLGACDIFCFPSITRNEAFGLALAEAMFFKKPSVTFKIYGSGVNFVNVKGVTGLEVENSNSKLYAEALLQLSNKDLRNHYGDVAYARVMANFTESKFKENINNILEEIK